MIFRLVAIAFVFVNIVGSASAVDPATGASILAAVTASAANTSTTLDVNTLYKDIVATFKGAAPKGAMITNYSGKFIEIMVCNDVMSCMKSEVHIGPGATMPVTKTNLPFSSGHLKVKINGHPNTLSEGQYYNYAASNGLSASQGTIAGWSAAARTVTRRRLLKSH